MKYAVSLSKAFSFCAQFAGNKTSRGLCLKCYHKDVLFGLTEQSFSKSTPCAAAIIVFLSYSS